MSYSAKQFYIWVKKQVQNNYEKQLFQEDLITFQSKGYVAQLQFYDDDIIELSLVEYETQQNRFYLHFQANDEEHAKELFNGMVKEMEHLQHNVDKKILIVCSSALTSSYFSLQLNEAGKLLKTDYVFEYASLPMLYQKGFDYDAILLTPQVAYDYVKIKKILQNQIILKLSVESYACYNCGEVLNMLNNAFAHRESKEEHDLYEPVTALMDNQCRILVIGVVNHRDIKRIAYRIYDHGKRTLDNEVIKNDLELKDIEDLLDYIFARHTDIDSVILGLPGVEENGSLNWDGSSFIHEHLISKFNQRYHHSFYLLNDVNAIALGYSCMHEEYEDMLFYFQPQLSWVPGAGLIAEGKLHKGFRNASGEMRPLLTTIIDHPEEKILNPEGALEIVSKGLMAFICTYAPKNIVLYSEMTPDVEEIRSVLEKSVPKEYVPPITKVVQLKESILTGLLSYGLQIQSENDAERK